MTSSATAKDAAIFEQRPPLRSLTGDERSALLAVGDHGVLATISRTGFPQLSTVLYSWDPAAGIARISTRADRAKARNIAANAHTALFVEGPDQWSFVVAEGDAELSSVSTTPGDATGIELLGLFPQPDPTAEAAFFEEQVAEQRVVIRFHVARLYGDTIELLEPA
jgi:PPOX class probable F420-dependent enzyme